MGGQHALHATDAPHDRHQDELQERVDRTLAVLWLESQKERPETDLTEVVEHLVEEGHLVEGMHTIDGSGLVEFLSNLAVVTRRGLPVGDLGQP
jgi:hypothetical protein